MRSIAESIGQGLGVPVRSLRADEAAAHFGWLSLFVAVDNATASALTRDSLGWWPRRTGLVADMRDSGYFA